MSIENENILTGTEQASYRSLKEVLHSEASEGSLCALQYRLHTDLIIVAYTSNFIEVFGHVVVQFSHFSIISNFLTYML